MLFVTCLTTSNLEAAAPKDPVLFKYESLLTEKVQNNVVTVNVKVTSVFMETVVFHSVDLNLYDDIVTISPDNVYNFTNTTGTEQEVTVATKAKTLYKWIKMQSNTFNRITAEQTPGKSNAPDLYWCPKV